MLNVLSIGGNALQGLKRVESLLRVVERLSASSSLLITHGNGPQVGELASVEHRNLGIITAQTEAEIGLELERQMIDYFERRKVKREIEVVLTEVLVDAKDPAFRNPSKPIGRFYSSTEAKRLQGRNLRMKHLIGGYRRVVASPKPKKVLNLDSIQYLLKKRYIVIAGGGGGIPLLDRSEGYRFAEAVIDKDYTSALLARSLSAKRLFILTKVDGVYLDFKGKNQRMLGRIKVGALSKLMTREKFEEGSMKPKLAACIDFVRKTRGTAVIGNIRKAEDAIALRNCTVILP